MTIVKDAGQVIEAVVPQARAGRLLLYGVAALLAAIALGAALWWVLIRPVQQSGQVAQGKVDGALGKTAGDVAAGALPQINDGNRQKVLVDVQVQKGTNDVRSAPDAGVAVRGVSDAVLRNGCLLDDLYRADPACQSVHEDPARVGPARSDAGRADGADRR